jgi:hypothetical protein
MRVAALLPLLLIAAPAAAGDAPAADQTPTARALAAKGCENGRVRPVAKAEGSETARPLNRESSAVLIYGVQRLVDGCDVPIVIRDDVK